MKWREKNERRNYTKGSGIKIIAIVRGVYGADCVKLAQALYDGGIELMEVSFDQSMPQGISRTADMLRQLVAALGDRMIFGAGTVLVCILTNDGKLLHTLQTP